MDRILQYLLKGEEPRKPPRVEGNAPELDIDTNISIPEKILEKQ